MITEFTKPWNNARVWFDSDEQAVVFKEGYLVLRYKSFCEISQISGMWGLINVSNLKYETDPDKKIDENFRLTVCSEVEDVVTALKKAFDELSEKKPPFPCPKCAYGQLLRICHEPPNYGEPVYICKDMTRERVKTEQEKQLDELVRQTSSLRPVNYVNYLDYEDGPGGWDGKTCVNFKEIQEIRNY